MRHSHDEILDALLSYDSAEAAVKSRRFLFHGTGELIEGQLQPGGDDVLWTALSPAIAQLYIRDDVASSMIAAPRTCELDRAVTPGIKFDDFWMKLAEALGYPPIDRNEVTYDDYGYVRSWRNPPGWPSYSDLVRVIEDELGYSRDEDGYYKLRFRDGKHLHPAYLVGQDWEPPTAGELYVTLRDGMTSRNLQTSEENASDDGLLDDAEDYHNYEGFRQANADGVDLVLINDLAQSLAYGNIPHLGLGLTPQAASRTEWVKMPARYREFISDRHVVTTDFSAFFDRMKLERGAEPSTPRM